jgi:hypothetical protein
MHSFIWMEQSVQVFLYCCDQHVSTWHPDKNYPPDAIYPSIKLFNGLQATKKELAEMLSHLQHDTKCAPGYCEHGEKEHIQLSTLLSLTPTDPLSDFTVVSKAINNILN